MKIFFALFLFTLVKTIFVSPLFPFGTKLRETESLFTESEAESRQDIGPISLDFALYWPDGFSISDNIYISKTCQVYTPIPLDNPHYIEYDVFGISFSYNIFWITGTVFYRTINK